MNVEETFTLLLGSQTLNENFLWEYQIPVMKKDEKRCQLHFQKNKYVISSFEGQDYPRQIRIQLKNYNGDIMANNIQTSTCLTFQLSETIPYENAGFFRDLIYISEEKKIDIGTMKYLAFRIFLDDETEPVQTPLTNKLNLIFKIIHI